MLARAKSVGPRPPHGGLVKCVGVYLLPEPDGFSEIPEIPDGAAACYECKSPMVLDRARSSHPRLQVSPAVAGG